MIVVGLGGSLKLPLPLQYNRHQLPKKLTSSPLKCVLTKQAHRFLSTLTTTVGDPSASASATHKLIQKFVASSPKSVSLNALSHLLSPNTSHHHLSALALPLYTRITEASWFDWNPKLVAELVALLDKQGRYDESETLISEAVSKLELRERELVLFYCNLVESHSKQGSKRGFDVSYARLNRIVDDSASVYVKRRGFESMVSGLCGLGRVCEAEKVFEEMRVRGVNASRFEFRHNMLQYDTFGIYGAHCELEKMVLWLRKMRASGIGFSIRTYNSVLNSCPTIMSMMLHREMDMDTLPLSWVEELQHGFKDGKYVIPREVTVVCGSGKHSNVRGESPLKGLVRKMLVRMNSPMRNDRKNLGCFVAKGKVVRDWLC
uniref:Smr domain-containing protein n=1 Tax=Fagus sylvatica TaxID=28930 RepID=A0A2N9HHB9_FAGSY